MTATCLAPPPGWTCTRPVGHDGPCAASPATATATDTPLLDAIALELAARRRLDEARLQQMADLRAALESIIKRDKTVYEYHGPDRLDRDGQKPPQGQRWLRPREIALRALEGLPDADTMPPFADKKATP